MVERYEPILDALRPDHPVHRFLTGIQRLAAESEQLEAPAPGEVRLELPTVFRFAGQAALIAHGVETETIATNKLREMRRPIFGLRYEHAPLVRVRTAYDMASYMPPRSRFTLTYGETCLAAYSPARDRTIIALGHQTLLRRELLFSLAHELGHMNQGPLYRSVLNAGFGDGAAEASEAYGPAVQQIRDYVRQNDNEDLRRHAQAVRELAIPLTAAEACILGGQWSSYLPIMYALNAAAEVNAWDFAMHMRQRRDIHPQLFDFEAEAITIESLASYEKLWQSTLPTRLRQRVLGY